MIPPDALEAGRALVWDIAQFLTDGELVALLRELGAIAGCDARLYTRLGRRVELGSDAQPWQEVDDDELGPVVQRLLGEPGTGVRTDGSWVFVTIAVRGSGAGVIALESPSNATVRLAQHLASTMGELCDRVVELRERSDELALIFELSSLLMTTHDVKEVAEVALRSAVWILGVDAGTVHLIDGGGTLRLQATFGLSDEFTSHIDALPAERVVDADAISGSIVSIPDLVADGRSLLIEQAQREGLVGMLSGGLIFSGNQLGLMRLYTKRSTEFKRRHVDLLRTVAEQVASAVEGARHIEQRQRARRERRHMKLAGDVQKRMLPDRLPDGFPKLEVGARYVSSFEVGGDFYDLLPFERSLGIAIGDVVGKGVPAALLMGSLRASLRAHAQDMYHIDDVIKRVNVDLRQYTLSNEFATLFYGVINHDTLRMTYCNAGHEPPIVFRARDGAIETHRLEVGGLVVGIDHDLPYQRGLFDLEPGDVLLGVTDGVTEAMSPAGAMYRRERLIEDVSAFLIEHPDAPAQAIVDHALWCVRRFAGIDSEGDDLTLVGVRVQG